MLIPITIFDLETNGLNRSCSVLQASALRCIADLDKGKVMPELYFNRSYYPMERLNMKAVQVNKLTFETIAKNQANSARFLVA